MIFRIQILFSNSEPKINQHPGLKFGSPQPYLGGLPHFLHFLSCRYSWVSFLNYANVEQNEFYTIEKKY